MAAITLRPTSGSKNEKVGVDWWLVGTAVTLMMIGVLSIFSSTYGSSGNFFRKQILNIALGIIPMSIFGFCHPRLWAKAMPWIYIFNVVALAAVLVAGKSVKGAERWIPVGPIQFQPSELAKILIVITLATFYANRQDRIREFSTFALGFLHVLVPVLLILKQPHLGASMLLITVWLALSLVSGVPVKYVATIFALFALVATLIVVVPAVRNRVLKPYQADRIEGLINYKSGKADKKGDNYQTELAAMAFGSGGLAGTGFLKGEVKHRIPDQHNDFIFSLIGEEFGLLGAIVVLGLYCLLFQRIWLGIVNATDYYYQMIMAGILTVFAFHAVINIGMVTQVFPVVGMWCPFLSYGGTAIWLCMSLVGLALNVRGRERAVLF
jgi:rod shape determining protein RodA